MVKLRIQWQCSEWFEHDEVDVPDEIYHHPDFDVQQWAVEYICEIDDMKETPIITHRDVNYIGLADSEPDPSLHPSEEEPGATHHQPALAPDPLSHPSYRETESDSSQE